MGTRLDAMKAATAKAPILPPSVVEKLREIEKSLPDLPAANEQPAQGSDLVEYRCGHSEPIKVFKSCDCPACRKKTNADRIQRQAAKREAKHVAKAVTSPPIGRLPDGATFHATWDATAGAWTGELVAVGQTFTGTASSLEKGLLAQLGRQCRESLTPNGV